MATPGWPSITPVLSMLAMMMSVPPVAALADAPNRSDASQRVAWSNPDLLAPAGAVPPLATRQIRPDLEIRGSVTMLALPQRKRRHDAPQERDDGTQPSTIWWVLSAWGPLQSLDPAGSTVDPNGDSDASAAPLKPVFDFRELARANGETFDNTRHICLDPNFVDNGFVYAEWSIRPRGQAGGTRISRLRYDFDSATLDAESRLDILTYPAGDHVGTCLRFGPDGMLWITTGDGTPPHPPDQERSAQNLMDRRGKVLRVDVRKSSPQTPYEIPKDNPFHGRSDVRNEIYAIGLRNGFRSAFHPRTRRLWVADVGWEHFEMVHQIVRGGNHGWSVQEASYPVNPDQTVAIEPIISPAIALPRDQAQSITGGHFVSPRHVLAAVENTNLHRSEMGPSPSTTKFTSALHAHEYLFGCYMNGTVWAADVRQPDAIIRRVVARTGNRMTDIVQVPNFRNPGSGETITILVDQFAGLFELVPNPMQEQQTAFPTSLSQSGLFADVSQLRPAPGVIEYQPAVTRDGPDRRTRRHLAIAGDRAISKPKGNRQNHFPKGSVVANTISRQLVDASGAKFWRRMETQWLVFDGLNWNPYTFRWNPSQTDATLVKAEGDSERVRVFDPLHGPRDETYRFASRSECLSCHHVFNDGPITWNPYQLHGRPVQADWIYTDWADLVRDGYASAWEVADTLKMHGSGGEDLDRVCRSMLDVQCAACHRPTGGTATQLDLRHTTPLEKTRALDTIPLQGEFGLANAKLISAGHPEQSVLMYRIATHGPGSMPKSGCRLSISQAAKIWDWIEQMEPASKATRLERTGPAIADHPMSQALLAWRRRADRNHADAIAAVAAEAAAGDPVQDGLRTAWISPKNRQQKLGEAPEVDGIAALTGDAAAGRNWFERSHGSTCRNCHRIGDVGRVGGPDLTQLTGTPNQWLHHILHPSEKVDPKWRATRVLTLQGDAIVGVKIDEDDEHLVLRDGNGARRVIALDEIDQRRASSTSTMPTGLLADLTAQQAADLLAFLSSIQRPTGKPELR
ncbi:MAG: PQQ-dependent sugar dehydrogenase [Planctomycetota bacterium]